MLVDINDILGTYKLKLDGDEAFLIDWLFTLHGHDSETYRELLEQMPFKEELGKVILEEKDTIELSEDELNRLLIYCPITFRWGDTKDCGLSLKRKLYKLKLRHQDEDSEGTPSESPQQKKFDDLYGDA